MYGSQSQSMNTASSELQQRLEHLITYSTQLIFVSGEGVGSQHQLAERFIAEQPESTNLVYVPTKSQLDVSDYRRRILQQLALQGSIDPSRPLAESFSRAVAEQEHPILICISTAEGLPKTLLQELWDLVLQNRFARHRFHLNVLLFADDMWAAQAKSWLPGQHQEQPVLVKVGELESQPVEQNTSELEQMIAQKRQAFAQRMESRKQTTYIESTPLVKRWWMKALIATVFLLSFGSLVLWQHYDVTKDAVMEFTRFVFQTDLSSEAPHAGDDQTEVTMAPAASMEPSNSVDQEKLNAREAVADDHTPDTAEPSLPSDGQRLVTDWNSAVKALDNKLVTVSSTDSVSNALATVSSEPAQQEPDPVSRQSPPPEVTSVNNIASPESADFDITQVSTQDDVNDYPVADITSVDQLQGKTYSYDETQLLGLDPGQYVLQLSAMSSKDVLQQFIRTHQLQNQSQIYVTQRYGGDWHVVLMNQSFDSINEAREAVAQLSSALQSEGPFAKSVTAVKREIEQPAGQQP